MTVSDWLTIGIDEWNGWPAVWPLLGHDWVVC